jgi:hypothetical protein
MSLFSNFGKKSGTESTHGLPSVEQTQPTAEMISYARLLTGEEDSLDALPMQDALERGKLDYSLGSLEAVDAYLVQVRPLLQVHEDAPKMRYVVRPAGGYLGEVLRRHGHGAPLNWAGYADLERLFGDEKVKQMAGGHVRSNDVMLGAGEAAYLPFSTVLDRIMSPPEHLTLPDAAQRFLARIKGRKLDNWLDLLAAKG